MPNLTLMWHVIIKNVTLAIAYTKMPPFLTKITLRELNLAVGEICNLAIDQ